MPLDVLFSTALFYALYRNEVAVAKVVGLQGLPKFPYLNEQAFGAFVGLCIFFLWVGKRHFRAVLKNAFGREGEIDDTNEPMRYRTAVWGLILGLPFLHFCSTERACRFGWLPRSHSFF